MITIEQFRNTLTVAVFGELTLADYREFEEHVRYKVQFEGPVSVVFDLRDMTGYTLDMAWEEIRFAREHPADFGRVAVVTDDQWIAWTAWLQNFFTEAEVRVFDNVDDARAWVAGAE